MPRPIKWTTESIQKFVLNNTIFSINDDKWSYKPGVKIPIICIYGHESLKFFKSIQQFPKSCSRCNAERLHESMQGEANSQWKGGKYRKKGYHHIWYSKTFQAALMRRDGGECWFPGCDKNIENHGKSNIFGHHIDHNGYNCDMENIITVCRKHNSSINRKGNTRRWIIYFQFLMSVRKAVREALEKN